MKYKIDFINSLGLTLSLEQLQKLQGYVDLVWEKKENLNLTSAQNKQEIWDRHICDGLAAAAVIAKQALARPAVADYGAGAGYIGITIACALPQAEVSLIESIEKRCMFMDWAVFKLGLKNVKVLNIRAGQARPGQNFDFAVERAMGKIDDIMPLCAPALKQGGLFIAYQAQDGFYAPQTAQKCALEDEGTFSYKLPADDKTRKLVFLRKK